MEAAFAAGDALTPPGTAAPTDVGKSGGPGSLVRWEQLGNWGRAFVAKAPTASEISAFTGTPAKDPVRVYVGRLADPSPQVRAEIALNEVIRQGGFDRKVLLLGVPVGSGWMDPGANDTLEFMNGGDVATVAVQYSHLTSVLSLHIDPQAGIDQAATLFDAEYAYWTKLPRDHRPRLYLTGLSQAAFNSQQAVPFFNLLGDPIDGALWAGSPFLSSIRAHVRDRRVPLARWWRSSQSSTVASSTSGADHRSRTLDSFLFDPATSRRTRLVSTRTVMRAVPSTENTVSPKACGWRIARRRLSQRSASSSTTGCARSV